MYKKILLGFSILITLILSSSLCFANDASQMVQDVANGVRNAVGGAENAVEDATKDISNGVKDVTNSVENGAQGVTNGVENSAKNATNKIEGATQNTMNSAYNATRTSVDANSATLMGMNATAWTWLIMAISAIAIVALVWYYGTQRNSSHYNDR